MPHGAPAEKRFTLFILVLPDPADAEPIEVELVVRVRFFVGFVGGGQDRFEGLCTLVSKTGVCYQCKGLQMIAPEDKKGGPIPDLDDFVDRCAVVRKCKSTTMEQLHNVFWKNTKEIEEKGLGSVDPQSDCGTDDASDRQSKDSHR